VDVALTFFDSFFVSRQKRNWGLGQSPTKLIHLSILSDIHYYLKVTLLLMLFVQACSKNEIEKVPSPE
jgi:hypothetical protein